MKSLMASVALAALLSNSGAAFAGNAADSIDGRWDAALTTASGTEIAFRLDLSGSAEHLKGTFYDGFRPYDGTTSASFRNGRLVLGVEQYLTTITAQLEGGRLVGSVASQGRGQSQLFGFHAVRHMDEPVVAAATVPNIAGSWEIPLRNPSAKGEKAFRFFVEQRGAEVAATILRIDGDFGSHIGTYKDGKWVLSHFDGGRPSVIVVTPNADGTLSIQQRVNIENPNKGTLQARQAGSSSPYSADDLPSNQSDTLVAYRPDVARTRGLPPPDGFLTHTTVRDPHARFTFSFLNDHGKLVTDEDPRFKGKVVLAIVTGTWCPNCHDEAQYLVQLDRKYRSKGLAIVALDFEEPEQQSSLERERAFVQHYGVKYTYLIAGAPEEMWEKVPQLVNLNTWPATIFIGRDGTVRAVHSGFASPASGDFNTQLHQEFEAKIQALLAEKAPAQDAQITSAAEATAAKPVQVAQAN